MEKRLLDRYNLQMKAILSFTNTTTKEARTLNISGDGAFIMTSQIKPVGSKIFISLLFDAKPDKQIKRKTVIKLEGTVRRTTIYGMAVCFHPCQCDDDASDSDREKEASLPDPTQLDYATEMFYADQAG
jgi:hypothetical protein